MYAIRSYYEPALGLDRGHAAGAGGGDGLPVDGVLDVSTRPHAFNRRAGRTCNCHDVPDIVRGDLAAKDVGVRPMADCDSYNFV